MLFNYTVLISSKLFVICFDITVLELIFILNLFTLCVGF